MTIQKKTLIILALIVILFLVLTDFGKTIIKTFRAGGWGEAGYRSAVEKVKDLREEHKKIVEEVEQRKGEVN